ncbi:conserved protein, unknown function, partial [Hepatocystis sp. ex Piliocolobus tephrosceles]
VDDIPLRVSSYSGCNQFNTAEMIQILQENNEIILCVGNSLNCCNFKIFKMCDYSVSVLLPLTNICKDCYGKKEKTNPFEDNTTNKNMLITYSSTVNSLPCKLTIEKSSIDLSQNILELVYKLLKGSRIYKKNISLALFYFHFFYSYLSFFLFIIAICFLPPIIAVVDYLLFIFIIIPVLSVILLNNNNNSTIMNDIPDKNIKKDAVIKSLIFYLIRWLAMVIFSFALSVYYLSIINSLFVHTYIMEQDVLKTHKLTDIQYSLVHNIINYCNNQLNLKSYYQCHISMHLYSESLNIGGENMSSIIIEQYESLFRLSCIKNSKSYFSCLLLFFFLSSLYITVRIYMLPSNYIKQYPDATLIILIVIFNVLIIIINEVLKKIEEKIRINRQKYLKVLFGTRLGMWSPK